MGLSFPRKNRYDCVWFNVFSITRGLVGVNFQGKRRYITVEWPPLCESKWVHLVDAYVDVE